MLYYDSIGKVKCAQTCAPPTFFSSWNPETICLDKLLKTRVSRQRYYRVAHVLSIVSYLQPGLGTRALTLGLFLQIGLSRRTCEWVVMYVVPSGCCQSATWVVMNLRCALCPFSSSSFSYDRLDLTLFWPVIMYNYQLSALCPLPISYLSSNQLTMCPLSVVNQLLE
jgi:hypothetical protein